jgi:hypothetical protein
MADFIQAEMIDGIKTLINAETIIHLDVKETYLSIHFQDDCVMQVKKDFLNSLHEVKQ